MQAVRLRRVEGQQGPELYQGLPDDFGIYLQRHCCPNVHRWHDKTTRGLHEFSASNARISLCRTAVEEKRLKRLFVLNYFVWRFVGGTVAFAGECGFLRDWGLLEKDHIRTILREAFRANRIPAILSNAYSAPRAMRKELLLASKKSEEVQENALSKILYNQGPNACHGEPRITYETLVGKFQVIDKLWAHAEKVVEAAESSNSKRKVADVLKVLPYFGTNESSKGHSDNRHPGFFAKELIEDLIDTPVFPTERRDVVDRKTMSPVGPGSLEGAMLCGLEVDGCPIVQKPQIVPRVAFVLPSLQEMDESRV